MSEELPPSTVPSTVQLSLMGFPSQEAADIFTPLMSEAILDCGRFLDLERLAGVTVGFDFKAALESVELGYESKIATQFTNNGDVVAVAKAMNVLRDGKVMSHVVYNANLIFALTDPDHEYHLDALHIIAHEFGHVAELKWRDEAMPGILLQKIEGDWVDATMLQTGMTAWEEYAACRLTGLIGDQEALKKRYAEEFDRSATHSLQRAQAKIKEFRDHGDVDQLLVEAGEPIAMPFKMAGYLLGHLDGIEDSTVLEELCPEFVKTHLAELIPKLRVILRTIWDEREHCKGVSIFNPLKDLIIKAYGEAGIEFVPQDAGGYYINVPFSAATLPNGELDMMMIRIREAAGLNADQ
ncbi:hypothetical protein [Xanthomonas cannabis]|uniref:hypothetical protein n=1 Tax=Xanthomonas cannabis TaxID=1885674 RepID=UPI0011127313|nr:hypothetical protein [Xanthomonas cannabis]